MKNLWPRARTAIREILRFEERGLPRGARITVLLLSAFLITFQNLAYLAPNYPLDRSRYEIKQTSGLKNPEVYVFGLYYWGIFPVYSTVVLEEKNHRRFSPEYAQRILREEGKSLRMEYRHTARVGNSLKLYLPWLAATAFRQPLSPAGTMRSLQLFSAGVFLLALYLLLQQFALAGRPILGALTAFLLSSSEFQAVEITRSNIFSSVITTAVFTLALLAPLIFNRPLGRVRLALRLLILAGIIVFAGNIRPDAFAMILAPLFILLLYRPLRFRWRLAAVTAFVFFGWAWHSGICAYFDFKWEQAEKFVREHGGTPYLGERVHYHAFWHPIWCGLGDFDADHGYNWVDWKAWNFALKVMRDRGIVIENLGAYGRPKEIQDAGDYYYIDTHPAYEPIIREKILADIRADPLWYLKIIGRRLQKIFSEWQEPRLNFVGGAIQLPCSFWPYVAFLLFLLLFRMGAEIKLILAAAPTALTAVAVTTITNAHYYFIGHLVCAAVFLACLANAAGFGIRKSAEKTTARGK